MPNLQQTTVTQPVSDQQRACNYLAAYASTMLGCGASCIRITRNMDRMAGTLGLAVDLIILPSHVSVTLTDEATGTCTHSSCAIAKLPISYNVNTRLSRLSWDVAEGRLTLRESEARFKEIARQSSTVSKPLLVVLVAFANASFCRLFGGDWQAMTAVGAATVVGYLLKMWLLKHKVDLKLMIVTCSFVSSLIGSLCYVLHWGSTPEIALGTSVLYLIPGIIYINAVSDMLTNHYLCWLSRFMQALIMTACIAIGLTGGYLLMDIKMFL